MPVVESQIEMFSAPKRVASKLPESQWGTFSDSLRAPVHRWFTYPAGYSFKAVEHCIAEYKLKPGNCIYDPFMGTGTTNLVAKSQGINSLGVEAHPFVFAIARTKLNFELPLAKLSSILENVEEYVRRGRQDTKRQSSLRAGLPELVHKCYAESTLSDLLLVRESIRDLAVSSKYSDFLRVALTAVLRQVANVQTGWPYIAPNKSKGSSEAKDALKAFLVQSHLMASDLRKMRSSVVNLPSEHRIFEGDARDTSLFFEAHSADLVVTSPPYLNNFDYADRTRLEMYFFGEAENWGDISVKVRTKLMTSATTQISRSDSRYILSKEIESASPSTYDFLNVAIQKLGELRLQKGGKKSYDLLVAGYFNDMFRVLNDMARVLKPRSTAVVVLGDSAPYGVHIPTDIVLGQIATGKHVGFDKFSVRQLRTRGDKWAKNPQRHRIGLREVIVELRRGK